MGYEFPPRQLLASQPEGVGFCERYQHVFIEFVGAGLAVDDEYVYFYSSYQAH